VFERIGTNYKMSNILAAVGLGQLEQIDTLLQKRRDGARVYRELLRDNPHVSLPSTTPQGAHSYQSFCVCIDDRDRVMQRLRAHGIEAQIGTYALHRHPAFQDSDVSRAHGDLTQSDYVYNRCMALPLFYDITRQQQARVVDVLTVCYD
jgi:dTDP-4-amino-4,6-dideoxygalactose transaminase